MFVQTFGIANVHVLAKIILDIIGDLKVEEQNMVWTLSL